jgi:hypothetical protein
VTSAPAEETDATDRQPAASATPVLPSSPEPPTDVQPPTAATPRTYDLRQASKLYDFRLEVGSARPRGGGEDVGPRGELTILHKGTNQIAQRLRIASLGDSASNADYDPELLVEDFDFDGHEDFALRTCDRCGPYGAPTYSVFLFTPKSRTFVHSSAISRLTEASLASMRADAARKRLIIASKSGCCIHWSEEYEVSHGIPRLMKRETEEETTDDKCVLTVETRRKGGIMQRETRPCP